MLENRHCWRYRSYQAQMPKALAEYNSSHRPWVHPSGLSGYCNVPSPWFIVEIVVGTFESQFWQSVRSTPVRLRPEHWLEAFEKEPLIPPQCALRPRDESSGKAIKKFALVAVEWVNLPCLRSYCVTQPALRCALFVNAPKPVVFSNELYRWSPHTQCA